MNITYQLIHPHLQGDHAIMATIQDNKMTILDPHLKRTLIHGISIPIFMQKGKDFDSQKRLYPKDSGFAKIFIEAYFPATLEPQGYILLPVESEN